MANVQDHGTAASHGQRPPSQPQCGKAAAWKGFVAGGVGGMSLVAAGYPLDLAKVRLQTSTQYTGFIHVLRSSFQREGLRGWYRGMSAPLVGVVPTFAINFWAYDQGVLLLHDMLGLHEDQRLPVRYSGIAGSLAGIPTVLVMVPTERLKVVMQAPATRARGFANPIEAVGSLYRSGGVASLYRGASANFLRLAIGSQVYFPVFEGVSQALASPGQRPGPAAVVLAGGLAGMAHWTIGFPFDTVKSRIQSSRTGTYSGLADCFRKLVAELGVRGLYRGLRPALVRAFPANGACFLGRDVAMRVLDWAFPE